MLKLLRKLKEEINEQQVHDALKASIGAERERGPWQKRGST